eukprot:s243_g26.t1
MPKPSNSQVDWSWQWWAPGRASGFLGCLAGFLKLLAFMAFMVFITFIGVIAFLALISFMAFLSVLGAIALVNCLAQRTSLGSWWIATMAKHLENQLGGGKAVSKLYGPVVFDTFTAKKLVAFAAWPDGLPPCRLHFFQRVVWSLVQLCGMVSW